MESTLWVPNLYLQGKVRKGIVETKRLPMCYSSLLPGLLGRGHGPGSLQLDMLWLVLVNALWTEVVLFWAKAVIRQCIAL